MYMIHVFERAQSESLLIIRFQSVQSCYDRKSQISSFLIEDSDAATYLFN